MKKRVMTNGASYHRSDRPQTKRTRKRSLSFTRLGTSGVIEKVGIICMTITFMVLSKSPELLLKSLHGEDKERILKHPTIARAMTNHSTYTGTSPNQRLPGSDWRGYREDRVISFVHVGKAGGMTLRKKTALVCGLEDRSRNQACVDHKFPSFGASKTAAEMMGGSKLATPPQERHHHVLARQTKHYFHIWRHPRGALNASTSFLFALRDPIDRAISSYRYCHTQNCNNATEHYSPWSCELKKNPKYQTLPVQLVYQDCFPNAAMEDFAQATMMDPNQRHHASRKKIQVTAARWGGSTTTTPASRLRSSSISDTTATAVRTLRESNKCNKVARDLIQGNYVANEVNPHFKYNYEYYLKRTLDLYQGTKEVFGIRTKYQEQDMMALDITIGGTGNLIGDEGEESSSPSYRHHSWGSEHYHPSPLSEKAIQKLCCALQNEIDLYFNLLDQVLNLNTAQKEDSKSEVRNKCGFDASTWHDWKAKCQQRLNADVEFF